MTRSPISKTYDDLNREAQRRAGELAAARKDLGQHEADLKAWQEKVELHGEECDVLRIVGELLHERVRQRVEVLVTMALRSVFDSDYRFWIDMDHKRGQAVATPMIEFTFRGNPVSVEAKDAKGGGIVGVTAFVLQLVVLTLTRPRLARVMVLDERFRHVSREYLSKVAQLLKKLSDITKIQFILVTHKTEFVDSADKVFNVSKTGEGVTVIRESDS